MEDLLYVEETDTDEDETFNMRLLLPYWVSGGAALAEEGGEP